MQNMARFIRYLVLGGFLDKKKECWVLVVTVAATRGGSLNIAVQPWLKGNSTHKQEKKGIEKKKRSFTQDHETARATHRG